MDNRCCSLQLESQHQSLLDFLTFVMRTPVRKEKINANFRNLSSKTSLSLPETSGGTYLWIRNIAQETSQRRSESQKTIFEFNFLIFEFLIFLLV